MCCALWASGLWLRYATLQNLIPSFQWIAPPRPSTWRNPRKGRDPILPSGNLDRDCEGSLVCGTANCGDFRRNGIRDSSKNCCRKPALYDWTFCSSDSPCGLGEGDCDRREDCNADERLECGRNNCRDFDSSVSPGKDCCRESVNFDWNYCSPLHQCGAGEGDCDSDDECSGDLLCGRDNCKDFGDNEDSTKDCCYEVDTSSDDDDDDDSGTGGCPGCVGNDQGGDWQK